MLVSSQMGKQLSTAGKATEVFLGSGLKMEKNRRKLHAKKKKERKRRKELLGHENA